MQFLSASQQRFFIEIDKLILKLMYRRIELRTVKTIFKKNKVRVINLSHIKFYDIATVMEQETQK